MGRKRDLNIVHGDGQDRNFFLIYRCICGIVDHGEMITDRVRDF